MVGNPAGRVGRIQEDCTRAGVTAAASRSMSSSQPMLPKLIGTDTGVPPRCPQPRRCSARTASGRELRRRCQRSSAQQLDGLHARTGDEKPLGVKGPLIDAGVVVGESLSQFRQTALVGVECLAVLQRGFGRLADEPGCWQIALTNPERDQVAASARARRSQSRQFRFPEPRGQERAERREATGTREPLFSTPNMERAGKGRPVDDHTKPVAA